MGILVSANRTLLAAKALFLLGMSDGVLFHRVEVEYFRPKIVAVHAVGLVQVPLRDGAVLTIVRLES
jgi:hypothetical protein